MKKIKMILAFLMLFSLPGCNENIVKKENKEVETQEKEEEVNRQEVFDAKDQEVVVSDTTYHNDFDSFEEKASQIPVLMFHYFYDETTEKPQNNNFYSIQKFDRQLAFFKENGYYTLTMEELYDWLEGKREVPKNSLVITMDDGYHFTYDMAMPILEKYDYVGISFEITSAPEDYEYRNHLRNIQTESHTHNMHQGTCEGATPIKYGYIQCMNEDEAVADMNQSKQILNNCIAMAYPFGGYGGHAKEVLKRAGYKMAFTTQFGSVTRGMDYLELPRVRMSTESWFQIY